MDDVQLRYELLEKAKSLLISEWEHKVGVEEALARFESRPPVAIRQPTLHRIMVLAEKFYGFVKAPPANPTNPITAKPVGVLETPASLGVLEEGGPEDVEDYQDSSEDESPEGSEGSSEE